MKTFHLIALAAAIACAGRLPAAVADQSSNGFTVKITVNIQAPPAEVYRRIVGHIGDWWDPHHTYSGDAHNLSIEEKAMGCFCEKLPDAGVVRHMEVIGLMPGKSITLSGALGPLQALAAAGTMKIQLAAADGGTKVDLTYAVGGYAPAGFNAFAAPVDSVLGEQLARLKNYLEKGNPEAK